MNELHYAIIEAPSVLGLFPKGVERMPDALLEAGLAPRLEARHAGRVTPPAYDPVRDQKTLLLNPNGIASYTVALADAVERVFAAEETPIVLGGDCSILLGCLLALRRTSRSGLLFVDGHADFYQPEAEPSGEAASMDLALATGRGPDLVTNIDGMKPLVHDEDVVLLGRRDAEDAERYGSQRVEDTAIHLIDLPAVRSQGISVCLEAAFVRLLRPELDGFWLHLDVDVLDDAVMPAVDYRMPGGLSFGEVAEVLAAAVGSRRLRGIDVTIFNPALDERGTHAEALTNMLADALRG